MNIHLAFTDLNKIINSVDFNNLNTLSREAFIIPILKELQEKSFQEGKKEGIIENIKYLRKQL